MKGKINANGALEIERAGKLKKMKCRKSAAGTMEDYEMETCDDDCPLFGEPVSVDYASRPDKIGLSLCQTHWEFDEFTDERNYEQFTD